MNYNDKELITIGSCNQRLKRDMICVNLKYLNRGLAFSTNRRRSEVF